MSKRAEDINERLEELEERCSSLSCELCNRPTMGYIKEVNNLILLLDKKINEVQKNVAEKIDNAQKNVAGKKPYTTDEISTIKMTIIKKITDSMGVSDEEEVKRLSEACNIIKDYLYTLNADA